MKTSKARFAALILLAANFASAFWMVVIMIFIGACVAGTIFHGLYTIAASIDPANPPPNMPPTNSQYIDVIRIPTNNVPTNNAASKMFTDETAQTKGVEFGMTYGVVSEQGPWIRSGCNLAEITNSIVVTVTDTPDAYSFAWLFNGQWWLYSITSNKGDAGIVTQLDGPPSTDTNIYYSVVIERTPDFVQWTPIYTNLYCPDNFPQFFADTNAPADHGFYRTMTQ